jgi:N utilization substance protein B
MQLIYARMLGGTGDQRTISNLIEPSPDLRENDIDYVMDVTEGVWASKTELDENIASFSRDWPLSRMTRVDLAILRIAVYEMLNRPDVPPSVSINEAVELTHAYSTQESGAFVNGILGSIQRHFSTGTKQ